MKHARSDYDRIQDPDGRIPADEPVFIIRGQDVAGPQAVRYWAMVASSCGADHDIIMAALDQANAMDKWQLVRARKVPDMPK